jgi:histidinol-phosphate aminotransferase
VIEAIKQASDESLRLYPSPTAAPARAAIANRFGLRAEQIALGNGSDELLAMAFRAFVDPGQPVAFAIPTYPILGPLAGIHGAEVRSHPLTDGWQLPPALAADSAPLKFIVNPNSPTGTFYSHEAISAVVKESSGVVVLDEAYVDFGPKSGIDLLDRFDNLLILRTMSKSYALCGMRIGWAMGNPELIAALDTVKDSYNLNRLAIVAAVAAIEDREYHAQLVAKVIESRIWLEAELRNLGFRVEPSETNFLFVRPPEGTSAATVFEVLKKARILVRSFDRPPTEGWLRITIGTPAELETLVAALTRLLDEPRGVRS